jgi:hypothetical protein
VSIQQQPSPYRKEADLVRDILSFFIVLGWPVWRMNSGMLVIPEAAQRNRRVVRGAPAGTSDIVGLVPGGRFLAIECKLGRNKPTREQSAFIEQVRGFGGVAFVAYSLDDVQRELTEAGVTVPVAMI